MQNDTAAIELSLFAGIHPNGQPVLEKVWALALPETNSYRLLQSPLFVTGVARGDRIELSNNNPGRVRVRVRERSGQLALRVLSRDDISALAEELTAAIEKLGGELDLQTPRALVYSIHVAVGFREIEQTLDGVVNASKGAQWSYGNVYDSETDAPLNWWEALLNP